eukprot:gene2968-4978_t
MGSTLFIFAIIEIVFSSNRITGSLSLLGDGIHNLIDVISMIISFWADYSSKVRNSQRYTYGMQRAELLGGLINSILLLSTAIFITIEAIPKFFDPEPVKGGFSILIIASCGILISLLCSSIFGIFGLIEEESAPTDLEENFIKRSYLKFKRNPNLSSSFLHYVGDTISSLIVLSNGILNSIFKTYSFVPYIDPICSFFIVGIILFISIPLIQTVSSILLQKSPGDVDVVKIQERILLDIDEVIETHDFHVWQLVDSMTVCSMHVVMYELDFKKFNEIDDKIHQILHHDGIHNVTVQPEFINEDELEYATYNKYGKLVPLNLSCGCRKEGETCSTSRNSITKARDSKRDSKDSKDVDSFDSVDERGIDRREYHKINSEEEIDHLVGNIEKETFE